MNDYPSQKEVERIKKNFEIVKQNLKKYGLTA
jgi:hypothetical protein